MMPGGWTVHYPLTEEEKKLFEAVIGGILGVSYEPIAAATQVVAGTNYLFIAKYTMVTNPPRVGLATISIFAPLEGAPILEHITIIV